MAQGMHRNVKSAKLQRMYWKFYKEALYHRSNNRPSLSDLQMQFVREVEAELLERGEKVIPR